MKMKKQLLACALVLSLGVAAGTLPQGAINPPAAQLAQPLGSVWAGAFVARLAKRLWPQVDSAGCLPWTRSGHCTGQPPFPGDKPFRGVVTWG